MHNSLDRVARRVVERSGETAEMNLRVADALTLALDAAAARALSVGETADPHLALERAVFTLDGAPARSDGALRACAYPVADSLGAELDLAVQHATTIGVAVDVQDGCGRLIASATVQYSVLAAI
jgi:hypothetical protein